MAGAGRKREDKSQEASNAKEAKGKLAKYEFSPAGGAGRSSRLSQGAGGTNTSIAGDAGLDCPPLGDGRGKQGMAQEGSEISLSDLMKAIVANREMLSGLSVKVDKVVTTLNTALSEIQELRNRTGLAEERISELEDSLAKVQSEYDSMRRKIGTLEDNVEDLQNRSRRSNLRITGVPEGLEGSDILKFLDKMLRDNFGEDVLSSSSAIERAHRVPGRQLQGAKYPRPILAKLLNFVDKERIMRMSRAKPPIKIEGREIRIFPDYSPNTQKKRMNFQPVRKKCWERKIVSYLLYPARLKIITKEATEVFDSPSKAEEWLETYKGGE